MTIQYVMTHDEWIAYTVNLIPDACVKNDTKEGIAFDLAMEFGILTGLLPSGWYPDEAVSHLIDRENEKCNIDENVIAEFESKVAIYHEQLKSKNEQKQSASIQKDTL